MTRNVAHSGKPPTLARLPLGKEAMAMAVAQDFGDPLQSDPNGLIVPKTKLKYSGYECFIASIICLAFGCDRP